MTGACRQCRRTYHEAPEEACPACGHPAAVPAGETADGTDTFLERVHAGCSNRGRTRSIFAADGLVSVGFRVIALVSTVLLVASGVAVLL